MARRLVAEGERVELLALIDTDVYPRYLSWAEWGVYCRSRISLFARNFAGNPLRAVAAEIKGFGNAAVLRLGLGPHWENPGLAGLPPVLRRVRRACEQAFADYRPGAYGGPVTYFRASERTPRMCDPLGVWKRVTDLDVIPLTGRHLDLVRPPAVTDVAAVLLARLRARAGGGERVGDAADRAGSKGAEVVRARVEVLWQARCGGA
jgi:thioesterase domain-containing protein